MSHVQLAALLLEMQRRKTYSRSQVLALQQRQFRAMLHYVWQYSPFYRELYSSHGIRQQDLDVVRLQDLPVTSKELLMENFDEVVTDRRLKRAALQEWIEQHADTRERYAHNFLVLHTSGSSGVLGIYVYDRQAWNTMTASMAVRVSTPTFVPGQKTKLAYFAAVHGRFSGVTMVANAPSLLYTVQQYSLLTPQADTLQRLNTFQPAQLSGYASTITQLAEYQATGKLAISPRKIMVSGDPLTEQMEQTIRSVWNIPIINLYSASEASCMAARLPGDTDMTVFDDLQIVELVDDTLQEVKVGGAGTVLLSNLYNRAFPMIRYNMRDLAVRGTIPPGGQFSRIERILGRVNDALPIKLDNGEQDSLHPIVLSEFFVPGLEKIQFVLAQPGLVQLRYVAQEPMDQQVVGKFQELLHAKGACQSTSVVAEKVQTLPNDPRTGKFKLVVL